MNRAGHVVAWWAALSLGAIVVGLNGWLVAERMPGLHSETGKVIKRLLETDAGGR